MEDKLLTIIVPAYNVEKYIGACLDSLARQTVCSHRVILVDDGSKDRTGEICRKYVQRYPDIFAYVRTDNHGLGHARNIGIAAVKTAYMTFLDSDDWLDLNYVEAFKAELEQFSAETIDMIYTLPVIYDSSDGLFYDWHDKQLFEEIFYGYSRIVSAHENIKIYELEYSSCRKIFRTEFVRKIGFKFDIGVKWEDVYPHFYAAYYAEKCIGMKNVGFNYRINTDGQITGLSGFQRLDMVDAFARTWHFFIAEGASAEVCNVVFNQMAKFARWSISASSSEVSRMLYDRLRKFMKALPKQYIRRYRKSSYPRGNRWFVAGLLMPCTKRIYTDYILRDMLRRLARKIPRAHG